MKKQRETSAAIDTVDVDQVSDGCELQSGASTSASSISTSAIMPQSVASTSKSSISTTATPLMPTVDAGTRKNISPPLVIFW